MNKLEVAEIKKQFKYTQNGAANLSIDRMRGYYVDASGNVLSNFKHNFLSLNEDEMIRWLDMFKKGFCPNSVTKEFPLEEEQAGGIQNSLLKLCDDGLNTDEIAKAFFEKLAEADNLVRNRLYVLVHNTYDVPNKKGGESEDVYDYIVGYVMPVELEKPGFSFNDGEKEFEMKDTRWEIKAPEFTFIYPSFEDRQTDIHTLTCFIKKDEPHYTELIGSFFKMENVISKDAQKEAFTMAVTSAMSQMHISDSEKVEAIKAIQEDVEKKTEDRENPDDIEISVSDIKTVLKEHKLSDAAVETFETVYKEAIPADKVAAGSVLASTTQYVASGVKISVDRDIAPQVEIKHIDGQDYITIPVYEGGIEVNGVVL